GQHCRDVHVDIWMFVEEFAEAGEIVAMKREMSSDEFRAGMHGEEMIALSHQRFKRRILRRRPRALRELLQFKPTLVVLVPGIEKSRRFGNMNQDGNAELGALFKDGRKNGIVHVNALAVGIVQLHAEVLEDFQTLCTVLDVLLKTRRDA